MALAETCRYFRGQLNRYTIMTHSQVCGWGHLIGCAATNMCLHIITSLWLHAALIFHLISQQS